MLSFTTDCQRDDRLTRRKIHTVDADSGTTAAEIVNGGKPGEIAWSPDGKHLAIRAAEDIHDPSPGRLWVASATGRDWHDALPSYVGHVRAIAWLDNDTIMSVGISDQVSKFGTTDIPNEMHLVHSRTRPWENWDLFRRSSPVTDAPQGRTPILILGGKDDTRVHPRQSMELYRYLKTLGNVPVRLVRYPGEGHGNRKPAARYDYSSRLIRWMQHYLENPGTRTEAPPAPTRLWFSPRGELTSTTARSTSAGSNANRAARFRRTRPAIQTANTAHGPAGN